MTVWDILLINNDHSSALQLPDEINLHRCLSITYSLTVIFDQRKRLILAAVIRDSKFVHLVCRGSILEIVSRGFLYLPVHL